MSNAVSKVGTRSHTKKAKQIQRPTEAEALAKIARQARPHSVVVLAFPVKQTPMIDPKARFWQTVGEIVDHFQATGLYTARNAHRGYRAVSGIADRLADVGIYCTGAMVTEALARIEKAA